MFQPNESKLPVVSMSKFSILYFATMGWYALFWFYQCWSAVRDARQKRMFPILRSLFAVFFVHELFRYLRSKEDPNNLYPWNPNKNAWLFIIVGFLGVALTFAATEVGLGAIAHLMIFVVLLFAQFYVLYRVQLVINRINNDPFGKTNVKLTFENNLWIAFGFYLWFSNVYTAYLDATGQLTMPETNQEKRVDKLDAPENSELL